MQLPEEGSSSITPQIDLSPKPFASPPIQDGQKTKTMDGIPTQVPSVTPGTYTKNNWIATNKTLEPGDADAVSQKVHKVLRQYRECGSLRSQSRCKKNKLRAEPFLDVITLLSI